MKEKRLYKVLVKGLRSPYQRYRYKLGRDYHCDDFDTSDEPCSRGYYATEIDGLPYAWCDGKEMSVYEVDVWGRAREFDQYKRRYENIRLVRKCAKREIVSAAKAEEDRLGYLLSEVLYPINPLKIRAKKIDYKSLLDSWASVRESIGESVRASFWESVWASVQASIRESVWASVQASVHASVWAYISSLFPGIRQWKYVEHPAGENPFQPAIDLWRAGYVPSFDGTTWRLHTGPQADVIYEREA